ncbi:MAG TPA: deoxynucleoside kinase [Phototrophicaceae bacterium]|nr:deoxynucleoside kinase [Phototrophicaceae bacterium]
MYVEQPKYFIAIAGNIGAGKSTLTGMLADTFGWEPFYEANAENPYLADFYTDMPRWSFHSQVFFLGKRLEHHHQLLQHPGSVIQDRTVYEDAEIFACNLYEQGQMSERDYDAYRRLYDAIRAFVPPPHLLIYLQANVETLLKRIHKRGREFERSIAPEYLERLNRLYERWIGNWTACPVLRIETNDMDFQFNPDDFAQIRNAVESTLMVEIP